MNNCQCCESDTRSITLGASPDESVTPLRHATLQEANLAELQVPGTVDLGSDKLDSSPLNSTSSYEEQTSLPKGVLNSITLRLNLATASTAGFSAWLTSLLATAHCGECFFTRVLPLSAIIGVSAWSMHKLETLRAKFLSSTRAARDKSPLC